MPPIALITDLGNKDYFVGSMKGAILSINPKAKIIDITHQIPKQDNENAAFTLVNAAKSFPRGSIFVTVVDPGVGTERKCILLRTENELNFIGPDNGVFTLAVKKFGIESIRELTNEKLMSSEISPTFHGRDIMSPVAAHLSLEVDPSEVGPEIENPKLLKIKEAKNENGSIRREILKIDDFGNIVTNIGRKITEKIGTPGDLLKAEIKNSEIDVQFVRTFGKVKKGEILCYIGSANLLEIGKSQGNLASEINARKGDELNIKPVR